MYRAPPASMPHRLPERFPGREKLPGLTRLPITVRSSSTHACKPAARLGKTAEHNTHLLRCPSVLRTATASPTAQKLLRPYRRTKKLHPSETHSAAAADPETAPLPPLLRLAPVLRLPVPVNAHTCTSRGRRRSSRAQPCQSVHPSKPRQRRATNRRQRRPQSVPSCAPFQPHPIHMPACPSPPFAPTARTWLSSCRCRSCRRSARWETCIECI